MTIDVKVLVASSADKTSAFLEIYWLITSGGPLKSDAYFFFFYLLSLSSSELSFPDSGSDSDELQVKLVPRGNFPGITRVWSLVWPCRMRLFFR